MAEVVSVRVEGIPELEAALKNLTVKMQKEVAILALRAGGRVIKNAWKGKVPSVPHYWPKEHRLIAGAYRRSIGLRTKRTATGASGEVRSMLYYVRLVEEGSSKMSARHYCEDAVTESRPEAEEIMRKVLAEAASGL